MPDPRSKSQILIGVSFLGSTHKIFSGFKSLWAIPRLCRKSKPEAISLIICAASFSEKQTCSWIRVSKGPPLICNSMFSSNYWIHKTMNLRYSPSQTPRRICLRLQKTQSIAKCLGGQHSDETFQLHGKREREHVLVSCRLSWQHIQDLCRDLRRFALKHKLLHREFHQSAYKVLEERSFVKSLSHYISLWNQLTLKGGWKWRARSFLLAALLLHLLLMPVKISLTLFLRHGLDGFTRFIARNIFATVSCHFFRWICKFTKTLLFIVFSWSKWKVKEL